MLSEKRYHFCGKHGLLIIQTEILLRQKQYKNKAETEFTALTYSTTISNRIYENNQMFDFEAVKAKERNLI